MTHSRLLFLCLVAALILAGPALLQALEALHPCRSAAATRFDALTLSVEGARVEYTTFDHELVQAVQKELARSSILRLPPLLIALLRPGRDEPRAATSPILEAGYQLTLSVTPLNGQQKALTVEYTPPRAQPLNPGRLLCGGHRAPASPALLDRLLPLLEAAGRANRGELVTWELADELLPRYTVAELIDVETGLRFFVQRRAGANHADVQPLTEHDTETIKRIFGGTWTWERRPVLAVIGDRTLAASINGMPHGAGRIRDNNFPGHFCLYFLASRTHISGRIDRDHLLAVLRAAGLEIKDLAGAADTPVGPACDH